MKRALVALVIAVVVAVALVVVLLDQQTGDSTLVLDEADLIDGDNSDNSDSDAEDATSGEVSESILSMFTVPEAPADARPARVTRLADGDSFDIEWLDSGDTDELRLLGVNAPETDACFGDGAAETLEALIADGEILVEVVERDEFGRGIANVWIGEGFVNARLVELGAALAISDGGSHRSLLSDMQVVATGNQAGLWHPDECGAMGNVTLRIAEIVSDAPGPDNENPNGEWISITNDGTEPADLADWSIRDESTRHRFDFPDGFTLAAGAEVRVYSGCGDDTAEELYWCDGDPVWNNGGDTGYLVDPSGAFADSYGY